MLFLSLILVPLFGTLMISIFNTTVNDVAEPWGLFFQDNAPPQMEGLEELHNNIMFYLTIILFAVSWIMLSVILNYNKAKISNKGVNHGSVEWISSITPALILVFGFFIEELEIISLNIFDNILCSNDVNGQFSEITTITEPIVPSDCAHDKAKYNWDVNSVNICHVCTLDEANLICEVCSCNLHPECAPTNCDIDGDWKKD